jgi:hypothetical protein
MRFRSMSLLVVSVAFAACSDSSGPNGGLSRAEALVIVSAVSNSAQTSGTSAASATARPNVSASAVPVSFEHNLETSHPCPSGGTLGLAYHAAGTVDEEAGTAVLDISGSQTHAACAIQHGLITITINGDPRLEYEAHLSVLNQQPNAPFTVGVSGAFNWSTSDNRSGRCSITYDEVVDFALRRRTVEGNICGHTINETFTWTE